MRITPLIFTTLAVLLAGCSADKLTPNSHLAAQKQWNDARASVLTNLATDQFKEGNFEKCQQSLNQALQLQPDNPSLHLLAAKLAIEQGQVEVADSHLASARRLDPKNAEADYLNGVLLQRWHQPAKARQAYASASEKAPDELSYILAEAEMLVALHDPADALALLQSKLPSFEHSGVIRDEIGQLQLQQKQYDDAIASLREASILAAGDLTIREHLAFALLANQKHEEAAELFERLLSDATYQSRGDIHAALGECQLRAHQLTEARASFTQATKLSATLPGFWLGLAKVDSQLKDFGAAELAARKASSLDPKNAEAMCLLGYVRMKQGRLVESQDAFHSASELDPHDSVSVSMQGYLATRLGRPEQAKAFYSKALQLNPADKLANRYQSTASIGD